MTNNHIPTLRGHHLSLFADYYFRYCDRQKPSLDTKVIQVRGKYKLADLLEGGPIFHSSDDLETSFEDDYISRKYSPVMRKRMNNLWETLIENPEAKIKIVDGLDILCKFCPNYDAIDCGPQTKAEDKLTLEEYDITSGNIPYTSDQLLKTFIEYRKSTGFRNPREKFLSLIEYFKPTKTEDTEDDLSDEEIERLMGGGK